MQRVQACGHVMLLDRSLCQWVVASVGWGQLWWNLSWSLACLGNFRLESLWGCFSPPGPTQTLLMYLPTTFTYFSLLWCSFGHFKTMTCRAGVYDYPQSPSSSPTSTHSMYNTPHFPTFVFSHIFLVKIEMRQESQTQNIILLFSQLSFLGLAKKSFKLFHFLLFGPNNNYY